MGELKPLHKSQPIISPQSINRLKDAMLVNQDKDFLYALWCESYDPIQMCLINEVARLKGYVFEYFEEDDPKRTA